CPSSRATSSNGPSPIPIYSSPRPTRWAWPPRTASSWATASGTCSPPGGRAPSGSACCPAATAWRSSSAPAPTASTTTRPPSSVTSTRSASASRYVNLDAFTVEAASGNPSPAFPTPPVGSPIGTRCRMSRRSGRSRSPTAIVLALIVVALVPTVIVVALVLALIVVALVPTVIVVALVLALIVVALVLTLVVVALVPTLVVVATNLYGFTAVRPPSVARLALVPGRTMRGCSRRRGHSDDRTLRRAARSTQERGRDPDVRACAVRSASPESSR